MSGSSKLVSILKSRRLYTLVVGILAGLKLILDAFGIHIITSTEVNQIANGFAALFSILSLLLAHQYQGANIQSSAKSAIQSISANDVTTQTDATHSEQNQFGSVAINEAEYPPQAASDGLARPIENDPKE
ncbi:hypothetical protein FY534_04080 [Alicyclobacillus sp. TC]|uniref:hypothetical protein n=1 Tax=Alicyclobacillus sp. TC TaxID=2606450 RepID=UPI001933A25B|nr:hypothetical protein [Alicyclobacillus sp. TC]QRF22946.1 hypothetical protein FY534_04080 [Alicyclobacillus sp. TC]